MRLIYFNSYASGYCSRKRKYIFFRLHCINQLGYNETIFLHQARRIIATSRNEGKNIDKKNVKKFLKPRKLKEKSVFHISYTRYMKNSIQLGSRVEMSFNLKQIITPLFFTILNRNFPLFSMARSLNS